MEKLKAYKEDRTNEKFTEPSGIYVVWSCNVINQGHERAEKIELQVSHAVQSLVVYSNGAKEVITGGTIYIPELIDPPSQLKF